MRRCLFEQNTITAGDGAAFFAAARSAVIESCTIRRNTGATAIRSGPVIGFANGARNLTVLNSLIHDNTGVGVFGFRNPQLSVISSTISRNVSTVPGGLAGGIETSAADVRVFNTILWDNRRGVITDEAAQLRSFAVPPQVAFCDIQGLTGLLGGAGNIGLDPLFTAPLAGNFQLRKASPAIDAGSNSRAAAGIVKDLRGMPRFLNDPSKPDTGVGPGPIIDMGAFEALPRVSGEVRLLPPASAAAVN